MNKTAWLQILVVTSIAILLGAGPTTNPTTRPIKKIIFVCDVTGSMMNDWKRIEVEVEKAVAKLTANQVFNIYTFAEGKTTVFMKIAPHADESTKQLAVKFLRETRVAGACEPGDSLIMAMKARPDAIFFASDGNFQNVEPMMKEIRRLFAVTKVPIDCCVTSQDDSERRCMWRIAHLTGGKCFDLDGVAVEFKENAPGPKQKSKPTTTAEAPATGPSIFDPK